MKQRPWKTLRCVVEVKVPPGNRSDVGDLKYQVDAALARHYHAYGDNHIPMPRAGTLDDSNAVKYRLLEYGRVVQAEAPPTDHVDSRRGQFEHGVLGLLWIIVLAVVFDNRHAARDRAARILGGVRAFGDMYGVQGDAAREHRRQETYWMPPQ